MIIRKYKKNMHFQNCKEIDKYFSDKYKIYKLRNNMCFIIYKIYIILKLFIVVNETYI